MTEQIGLPKSYLKQRLVDSKPAFDTFAQATGERYRIITSGNLQSVTDDFQRKVLKAIDGFKGETISSLEELNTICEAISAIKKEVADSIFSEKPGLSQIATSFRKLVDSERAQVISDIKQQYNLPDKAAKKEKNQKMKTTDPESIFFDEESAKAAIEKTVGKMSGVILGWAKDAVSKIEKNIHSEDAEYSKATLTSLIEAMTALVDAINIVREELSKAEEKETDVTFSNLQDMLFKALESAEKKIKAPAKYRTPEVQQALDELRIEPLSYTIINLDKAQFQKLEGGAVLDGDSIEEVIVQEFLADKKAVIKEGNGAREKIRVGLAEHEYLNKNIMTLGAESVDAIPHGRLKRMVEYINNEFHGGLVLRDIKFIKQYAESIIQEQQESLKSVRNKFDQLSKPSLKAIAAITDLFFGMEVEAVEIETGLAECSEAESQKAEISKKYNAANEAYDKVKKQVSEMEKTVSKLRSVVAENATSATTSEDYEALAEITKKLREASADLEKLKPELAAALAEADKLQDELLEISGDSLFEKKSELLKRQAELKQEIQAAYVRIQNSIEAK
jgi:hypothetical protein